MPNRLILFVLAGVGLVVTGLLLPPIGSAIATHEYDRVESELDYDCEPEIEFEEDEETTDDDNVRTGTAMVVEDCEDERRAAIEELQRDNVLRLAMTLEVGGWALRVGGLLWVLLGLRVLFYRR